MNYYNIITHPLTQEKLSINSIEAKNLLKNYIKLYNSQQNGGSFLETIRTAVDNVKKTVFMKKIPFSLHLGYNIDEQYKILNSCKKTEDSISVYQEIESELKYIGMMEESFKIWNR